jgi:hypothetical protein
MYRALGKGCVIMQILAACVATPPYFSTVANQVLRMKGGSRLGDSGPSDLNLRAVKALEQQVKRVLAGDPSTPLNISTLRDRPDTELLRILFLAMLGNYTSAAAAEWNRPCSLEIDPETGRITPSDSAPLASLALKVILVLLVAVQLKRWVQETRLFAQTQSKDK